MVGMYGNDDRRLVDQRHYSRRTVPRILHGLLRAYDNAYDDSLHIVADKRHGSILDDDSQKPSASPEATADSSATDNSGKTSGTKP